MPHDNHAQPVPPREPDAATAPGSLHPSSGTGPFVPATPYLPALPYGQAPMMAGASQAATVAAGGINSAGLIKAFKKRWAVAIILGLVFGGLAAAATWFAMPPSRYSGEILFNIDTSQPLLPTPLNRTEWINHQRVQQALVVTPRVLGKALQQDNVKRLSIVQRHSPEPAEWLAKELKTDYLMGPDLLHVSLKEDKPDELRVLLAAIGNVYVKEADKQVKKNIDININALQTAATEYEVELREARLALQTEQGNLQGARNEDSKLAHDFDRQAAIDARNRLNRVEDDLRRANLDVTRWTQAVKQASQITVPDTVVNRIRDEQMEGYQRDIARLTPLIENRKMLRGYTRDPQYRDLQRQLNKATQGLAARREELHRVAEQEARAQALRQANQGLATAQNKVAALKLDEQQIHKQADLLRKQAVGQTGTKGKVETEQVNRLKRKVEELDSNNTRVRKELSRLKLVKNNPPRVTLFDDPYTLPTNDIKIMVAATAGAGVLVFSLFAFGISWMEFRRHRIDTADEVVQQVGLPLVGTIPEFNGRPRALSYGRRAGMPADVQQNVLAESIDTIRTMLMHAARAESLQTVMIASAASREGKTTLACQLATSLARAGRKTLLIDGDLRKPMLHELYNAPSAPGLAEVLREEVQAKEAVQQTFVPGLWVLPAGQADGRAVQALSHEHFRQHLERLREDFDFVVVDSSPVLSAVEPLLFAQQVDAVVFAVLLDVSQVPAVQAAYRRLQVLGVRILGAVVSGTDTSPHLYDLGAYAYRNLTENTIVGAARN